MVLLNKQKNEKPNKTFAMQTKFKRFNALIDEKKIVFKSIQNFMCLSVFYINFSINIFNRI